ncbi:MAG: inositol monophosphatase [Bacteroidales bacterium]|nr:inositol monophosphatase [Bacteroidales bacterium]
MDLQKLTLSVCRLCEETGQFLRQEAGRLTREDIREKSDANFVTYVDEQSEMRLIEGLMKLVPESGFIAEESPDLLTSDLTWIIDPLDGTTNFIHNFPVYSISIALRKDNKIILGVVFEAGQREMYYTWQDTHAWMNGKVISVSPTASLNDSLFATGFPYCDYSRLDEYLDFFKFLMQQTRGVRRLGSAAADLAWVACGRLDGFYEYGLSPWDVAAGSLLVKNAGGKVCDFKGEENFLFGKEIIATNGLVHQKFLEHLNDYF